MTSRMRRGRRGGGSDIEDEKGKKRREESKGEVENLADSMIEPLATDSSNTGARVPRNVAPTRVHNLHDTLEDHRL